MVLVDSNVLLDVLTAPNPWADWSLSQLRLAAEHQGLCTNAVVFAEVSIGFETLEDVEAVMLDGGITILPIPHLALFRAGKAYRDDRRRGGTRPGVLPDFFIGAHDEAAGLQLLTRDATRYRSYFPAVDLIAP